jgi:hypothetical protein
VSSSSPTLVVVPLSSSAVSPSCRLCVYFFCNFIDHAVLVCVQARLENKFPMYVFSTWDNNDVKCLMSYDSCLMSHVLCLRSHVQCLMSHVQCLMSHVSWTECWGWSFRLYYWLCWSWRVSCWILLMRK